MSAAFRERAYIDHTFSIPSTRPNTSANYTLFAEYMYVKLELELHIWLMLEWVSVCVTWICRGLRFDPEIFAVVSDAHIALTVYIILAAYVARLCERNC